MTQVLYIDLNRCVYCRACEVACEREHSGISNMFVQLIDEHYAIPVNCRHCEEGACIQVCPTHAIHRQNENVVTIATMKCIGCGLCTLACPFGAVWIDVRDNVARKCDACLQRTEQGLKPACVTTCSSRALAFGDMQDFFESARRPGVRRIISRSGGTTGTVVDVPVGWQELLPSD